MKTLAAGISLALTVASGSRRPNRPPDRADAHVAAAKAAAGTDFTGLFDRICAPAAPPATPRCGATARPRDPQDRRPARRGMPNR